MHLKDKLFKFIVKCTALLSLSFILLISFFILKESIPIFKDITLKSFLFNSDWNPTFEVPSFGILNIILGTIYIAFLSVVIATPISIGASIYLTFYCKKRYKRIFNSLISILAGIPSVIYGFIGLLFIVKSVEKLFDLETGECVLSGGILLAIMVLPFLINTIDETFTKINALYSNSSLAMGIPKSYMIRHLVLPASFRSIICSLILGLGRSMGETMAVMMVIGNAPIVPSFLGKAETIPSLLALEVGSAEVSSLHYNALYASGLTLLVILILINLIFQKLKSKVLLEDF